MNKIELLGGTLAGMMFLSGCSPTTETNKIPTKESASTSGIPATETPFETYVPTATATEAPKPTVEAFPIDITKVFTAPSSPEDLEANLDKYVQAPDGIA